MKDSLPDDVRFSLLSESSCQRAIWESLNAVREEASDVAQTLRAVLEASETGTGAEGEVGEGLGDGGVAKIINPYSLVDPKLALASDNSVRVL